MKRRTRRQWKKLMKQVVDGDTFYTFCARYRVRTEWDGDPTYHCESYNIYRGWNLLASVDFIEYHHPEVGDVGEEVKVYIAKQKQWGRI